MNKLTISELIDIEKMQQLWDYRLFQYPLWIHCREPLLYQDSMAERKMPKISILSLSKSFILTIKFLFSQKKYDNVYFLMERAELLEIYKEDKNSRKILFLNPEQESVYKGNDYISSNFFSLLRFICRKVAFLLFWKRYREVELVFNSVSDALNLRSYIKIAFGDALFLKFLSIVLYKKNKKFYTGAVIPMGEKFVNALNSYEVQHGVIYPSHIGYIGLPKVKNRLILYSQRYEEVLKKCNYSGNLIVQNYKESFFKRKSTREFFIVIYTQPFLEMQEGINHFFQECNPDDIYIQKHPKDYYLYKINKKFFINSTIPSEVHYPIFYTSSVIENFSSFNRTCYIYDVREDKKNVQEFINIYTSGTKSNIIIKSSLSDLYEIIKKSKIC